MMNRVKSGGRSRLTIDGDAGKNESGHSRSTRDGDSRKRGLDERSAEDVTITKVGGMAPSYQIRVRAKVTKPLSNYILKNGYPKATLAGGTVTGTNPQTMTLESGDYYRADFLGTAGSYTATVTANWQFMSESGEEFGSGGPTTIP